MKPKTYYYILLLLGFVLVFNFSCKKDEDDHFSKVSDIEGNVYQTVSIGSQTWMMENLKSTKYNDGTSIPLVTDPALWESLSAPGFCWYDNDRSSYKAKYGALYNWHTINTGKLCPKGWHIPSDGEWITLINLSISAGYLIESGPSQWTITNADAISNSGFSAPPGGFRDFDGIFLSEGSVGFWFSSTMDNSGLPGGFSLSSGNHNISMMVIGSKTNGNSVRCIKD